MRKIQVLTLLFLGMLSLSTAQNKKITLEKIYGGAFRTEGMDVLRSMNNGKQYTVLNFDRNTRSSSIDKYDYETLKKTETILSSSALPEIQYFTSYTFSDDEQKILLSTQVESVYRRSTLGVYYVYDLQTKELIKLADQKIQEPAFSPQGDKVAYVFENNIYIKDLADKSTLQVTTDGKKNAVINGVTDWVYEEEFAFVRAFDWNADGTYLAYIRFDETRVPEFSMDVYGEQLYPQQHEFKYPKAGEDNAEVSLHVYELEGEQTSVVDLGEAYYIPRILWTKDNDKLSVQVLNRHQNDLRLFLYDLEEGEAKLIMQETDEAYVDITDNLTFLDDNSYIWTSEKDGFNHIYHYAADGKLKQQVTDGPWEVTAFYGYDPQTKRVFYQSVETGSINRDVYSIRINGKGKRRLSSETGTNHADFSADYTYFINNFSSASTPNRYTLHNAKDGSLVKAIVDNEDLKEELNEAYAILPKEFTTIEINGNDLNMWIIKPRDFDPEKSYPMLMYQYSGPGSQSVANRWNGANDYWYQMLADRGFVVACVDGRGTGFKGADFKKVTYRELGRYEVEDQIAAAKKLAERSYIDEERIGIFGWSYGGFMSSNCILKGSDIFSAAIAVAPVTSWRFYDTIYTERYMRTPQENPEGYDDNSPLSHVDKLQGDYLLVHGSADDNVHVQNTMRMVEALVQANKQFEWAVYPDKNHGIYGGNTRVHLFTRMTDFLMESLKPEMEASPSENTPVGQE
ncbi:S9 family peptidase [Robertkochia aurantiaca]|uniref:S9 family peptidase n=1 Tax=Robertkochia aurantiaca TaxID=2873700 RepID=UPI001CCE23D1|nr:S9 family peptidase [Robertkochia sp. 3YJGBD-33]